MAAKLRAKASGLNLFDIPSKMSREKSRRVKTGYLEQKKMAGKFVFQRRQALF